MFTFSPKAQNVDWHFLRVGVNERWEFMAKAATFFFSRSFFQGSTLTFNTNPPAHLATQTPLLFSLSFSPRQLSCLPPPPPHTHTRHPTPSFTSRTAGNWPKKTFASVYKFLFYQCLPRQTVLSFQRPGQWEPCKIQARALGWPASINQS